MPTEQDMFFESLYKSEFSKLELYAAKLLDDSAGAEEVVQDTFFTASQQLETLFQHENPKGFLMATLKNKIRERNRARYRYAKHFVSLNYDHVATIPAPSNPYPISTYTIMESIRDALTPEEWELFYEYYVQGITHMEIARKLHVNVWTTQKRLERIRKKLKPILPDF